MVQAGGSMFPKLGNSTMPPGPAGKGNGGAQVAKTTSPTVKAAMSSRKKNLIHAPLLGGVMGNSPRISLGPVGKSGGRPDKE